MLFRSDEMVDGITDSMDVSLSKLQEIVKDREGRDLGVAFQAPPGSQASSHSVVSPYFFALITEEGFLICGLEMAGPL